MAAVLHPGHPEQALVPGRRNRGASGVDGVTVDGPGPRPGSHWPGIGSRLLGGACAPLPVRRAEIPTASGGGRPTGGPTVLDRLIQQAVMQV